MTPTREISPKERAAGLRGETTAAVIIIAAGLVLRLWGLRSAVINDKFDEGVYLSLMQAVAAGTGRLYRDFLLCHPPGPVWLGAWLWPRIHGSLYALRVLYALLCMASFAPLYAIARRYYGARTALITLFLLCCSPAFANWLGRNIFLDLPLNLPLYTALWMLAPLMAGKSALRRHEDRKDQSPPSQGMAAGAVGSAPCGNEETGTRAPAWFASLLAGVLMGGAYLIKETALPCGVAIAAAMLWAMRDTRPASRRTGVRSSLPWSALLLPFSAGVILAFCLALAYLAHIPNYLRDTFTLNSHDVRRWDLRPYELINLFYAFPLGLTFGVAGLLQMLRSRRSIDRFLAAFACTDALIMLLVPKPFYWRYLTPSLPLLCLGFAVWWRASPFGADRTAVGVTTNVQRVRPSARFARSMLVAALALFSLVQVVDLVLYHTHESVMPRKYNTALTLLQRAPGPLFTLDPIWASASGHPLTPPVQQLIKATINVPVSAEEYRQVLAGCPTILLNKEALRWLPADVVRDVHGARRTAFQYATPGERTYVEILR